MVGTTFRCTVLCECCVGVCAGGTDREAAAMVELLFFSLLIRRVGVCVLYAVCGSAARKRTEVKQDLGTSRRGRTYWGQHVATDVLTEIYSTWSQIGRQKLTSQQL